MVDASLRERIREANGIVDVADYLGIKFESRNPTGYKARCPFHTIEDGKPEKTPSFLVNPTRQTYHCFSCEAGGDVFNLVQSMELVEFREALRILGERAGIEVATTPEEREKARIRQGIYNINEKVANFFQGYLKRSPEAQAYLERRKIKPETIEKFRIGWAQDTWDSLSTWLTRPGRFTEQECIDAGVVRQRESGGVYDAFRGRIMFPIWDFSGRNILGFGGRVIEPEAVPKYLNTPESQVFTKRDVLYGFNFASKAVRKQRKLIIVEGYTDVVLAHQFGIHHVAATIGTALSAENVAFLNRRKDVLVNLCFDGDSAGIEAAVRAVERTITRPNTNVWVLGDGKDPGDLLADGKDFRDYVETNIPSFEFLVDYYSKGRDLTKLGERLRFLEDVAGAIQEVPDSRRGVCIETLAQQIGITPQSARDVIMEGMPARTDIYNEFTTGRKRFSRTSKEIRLVQQMIGNFSVDIIGHLKELGMKAEDFQNPNTKAIFLYLTNLRENKPLLYGIMPLATQEMREDLMGEIVDLANENGILVQRKKSDDGNGGKSEMLEEILINAPFNRLTLAQMESTYLRLRTHKLENLIPDALRAGKSIKDLLEMVEKIEEELRA